MRETRKGIRKERECGERREREREEERMLDEKRNEKREGVR
jgi:hypothetical protein